MQFEAQMMKEHKAKHQFIRLNQTICVNEIKTNKMEAIQAIRTQIKEERIKVEVKNIEIQRLEGEISDLRAKKMVYKYKLKEIYMNLLKDPVQLL